MRISGHRSKTSPKSYSSMLSVQEKRIISDTLSDAALTQSCQMTFFDNVAEFDNNSMDSALQHL